MLKKAVRSPFVVATDIQKFKTNDVGVICNYVCPN